MTRRLRPAVALWAAAIFLLVIFLFSRSQQSEGLRKWASGGTLIDQDVVDEPERDAEPGSVLCAGADCFKGTWKPRNPPLKSIDELKPYKGCASAARLRGAAIEKASAQRLLNIMNWVWTPYKGEIAEWNAEEFVVRLLRSPGGLISVGGEQMKR